VARVNILKQVKTPRGWRNLALQRDARGRIKWSSGSGRYIVEWRENGRRRRSAAGVTPSEALEAQNQTLRSYGRQAQRLDITSRPQTNDMAGVHLHSETPLGFPPEPMFTVTVFPKLIGFARFQ
jgi:hypothetical protein